MKEVSVSCKTNGFLTYYESPYRKSSSTEAFLYAIFSSVHLSPRCSSLLKMVAIVDGRTGGILAVAGSFLFISLNSTYLCVFSDTPLDSIGNSEEYKLYDFDDKVEWLVDAR